MKILPFEFQTKLKNHFKQKEKTWKWFSDKNNSETAIENFKTELLKNTYRIDVESEPELYEIVNVAKEKLGIVLPITLYQSQFVDYYNATIVLFENEAHMVISGNLIKLLNDEEKLALFAHELTHVYFYLIENSDYEICNRIINSIANDIDSSNIYKETARLNQLFVELYCDLGSLYVCNNLQVVISTLVKIHTGLEKVSAESYLKQANEILEKNKQGSEGVTHPEIYLRARVLQMYDNDFNIDNHQVNKLIIGKYDLYNLNIFNKDEVAIMTKKMIDIVLKNKWTQSDYSMVLYKQYFGEFNVDDNSIIDKEMLVFIENCKESLKNYFAYVLLDFALSDIELLDPFLGLIFDVGEQLEIKDELEEVVKKELKISNKKLKEDSLKWMKAMNEIMVSDKENSF